MDDNKRVVEIGGVKLEVDLRHARVIENFKIGDTVKVLLKKYGDSYESHLGVIVGFDNFKERPTIVIAHVEDWDTDAGTKDKKLKSVRKAYEALIKKYPGTRAAAMAKKAKVGLPR